MIRTFQALTRVDPGFASPGEVQVARIAIPQAQVPQAEATARMLNEILERIEAMPGVESAAFGSALPMNGAGLITSATWTDTANLKPDQVPPQRRTKFVAPGFIWGCRCWPGAISPGWTPTAAVRSHWSL
jgi:hypothetical protein